MVWESRRGLRELGTEDDGSTAAGDLLQNVAETVWESRRGLRNKEQKMISKK